MSTRGTYQIYSSSNGINVCFYVHYSNYPKGAAWYFSQMLSEMYRDVTNKSYGPRCCYAKAFCVVNDDAQFTHSHESHSDAEYRYTLDKEGFLLAYRDKMETEETKWELFFTGRVQDFIEQYGIKEQIAA